MKRHLTIAYFVGLMGSVGLLLAALGSGNESTARVCGCLGGVLGILSGLIGAGALTVKGGAS